MHPIRSALVALLLLAGACAPAPDPAPAASPALWRIADADSEIWLFGSVHVLPRDLRWREPRVEAAFAAAEEFVTETDASPENAAAFVALAQRHGTLPEGETLAGLFADAAERARFDRVARSLGFNPAMLQRERPWLAALQLSTAAAERAGHSSDFGVETVLTAAARTQGKRLSYLETAEQQVRVLADLPRAEEMRFLRATLDDIENGAQLLDEMDRAWASGDVDTLERLLEAQWRQGGDALREAVLTKRNRAWADEIARRLDGEGRIFIAVGAAHLVGEDSLIEMLRARGIAVEGP